jgi:hypothetical protein
MDILIAGMCMTRSLLHLLLVAGALATVTLVLLLRVQLDILVDADLMVVKSACLACEERNGTPNFFTSY